MSSLHCYSLTALLLLVLVSPVVFATPDDSESSIGEEVYEEPNFFSAEHVSMIASTLNPSTGLIHLESGSFDPLFEPIPVNSNSLNLLDDNLYSGFAVIQLNSNNGVHLEQIASEYDFTVLSHLSQESWIVRLSEHNRDLSQFEDEEIRWVGPLVPDIRISNSLTDSRIEAGSVIDLVPSPDLSEDGLNSVVLDMLSIGAESAWCGYTQCQMIVGDISEQQASRIKFNLATDFRLLFSNFGNSYKVHNAAAAGYIGINSVINNASFSLNGSGETIAITDTGLDRDHPDLDQTRIAGVFTNFGLDPSFADSNSGHGTHVAISVLGDGSGDSSSTGIAPEANLVMYALEHDPTGVFGRQGSIYDLLADAEQRTARISVNAWGANGGFGEYTSDSRSVDTYVSDTGDLVPVFSVGDQGQSGNIAPPATAKNVISVGASEPSQQAVANFSSNGYTLDGRIKPDLVAPGVGICSGRAEEANNVNGLTCGQGTHQNGAGLYMSLSGSSQATAIAGGATALVREYIREQGGISSPSASIVKATLINGAQDLGTADIPNSAEGWGQIDLDNTIMPSHNGDSLATFMDDGPDLNPGYSILYSFDIDPSSGLDATLVWSDKAGSSSSAQSDSKLVNDLDLILVSPDGTEYLGNVFSNGYSQTGGSADDVNNVERVKIAPSSSLQAGEWLVKVSHRAGVTQDFSIVLVADATYQPKVDLAVFDSSISLSTEAPLKNDILSMSLSWINQGTLQSGAYRVMLEDLTTSDVLYNSTRNALGAGSIDSLTIIHSFTTTGDHELRLRIDVDNQVNEMNDVVNGTDNNIITKTVQVSALGVRVVPLNDAGEEPTNSEELSEYATKHLDVANSSVLTVPLNLKHEGTGNQSIRLTSSPVQILHPTIPGLLLAPDDTWSVSFSQEGPYTLGEQGEGNDIIGLNLILTDESADLDADVPRYAKAGTYVVDLQAQYFSQPFISHSQRITIVVDELNAVQVVAAGTNGLEAEPGESTVFSISVRNTGNTPAQYSLSCSPQQDGWQVMLGGSNSSSLEFEPLNILEYLPMMITIVVPPVNNGNPAADSTGSVSCTVTSAKDSSFSYQENVSILVLAQPNFETQLMFGEQEIAPSNQNPDISVDSGDLLNLTLEVSNTGNTPIDLEVSVQPSDPNWAFELTYSGERMQQRFDVSVNPGQTESILLTLSVPAVASEGDTNLYNIRVERNAQDFLNNNTRLTVRDEISFDLQPQNNGILDSRISDQFSYGEVEITNTGNVPMTLTWTHSLSPDGWQIGYSNPVTWIEPRQVEVVQIGVIPPANQETTNSAFTVRVDVLGENAGREYRDSVNMTVRVLESSWSSLSVVDDSVRPFKSISRGVDVSQEISVLNSGNVPLDASVNVSVIDSDGEIVEDWNVVSSVSSITGLDVATSESFTVTATPNDDADIGNHRILVQVIRDGQILSSLELEASVSLQQSGGGLFSVLPTWASISLSVVVLVALVFGGLKMRSSGSQLDIGEELVTPNAHVTADLTGTRRESALDVGHAVNEQASGSVSDDEIAAALAQSMEPLPTLPGAIPDGRPPSAAPLPLGRPPAGFPPKPLPNLPTIPNPSPLPAIQPAPAQSAPVPAPAVQTAPPLPAAGLPAGWTMEQWNHYGWEWIKRNQG